MLDTLKMFTWILVVTSFGLLSRNMSLQITIRHLHEDLALREMKIKKLTEQLNLFGGAAEI